MIMALHKYRILLLSLLLFRQCLWVNTCELISQKGQRKSGEGGSILMHVGTNNSDMEGKTANVKKYRQLIRTLK